MAEYPVKNANGYIGLNADTKPTLTVKEAGSWFFESDTGDMYVWGGAAWTQRSSGGSIAGTTPYLILWNTAHEDTAGGRESRLIGKGEQSGGEASYLGYIEFSHDGALDDEKGKLTIKLNDGNDATAPSINALILSSDGALSTASDKLNVDANGNITKLNNVTTNFPAANAAGYLYNDGSGNFSYAAGGATDHGGLTGLADDDHSQYILVAGTRAFTGNVRIGANYISNDGGNEGLSIDASGNVTASASLSVGSVTISNYLQVNGSAYFDAEYDNAAAVTITWANGNKQKSTLTASVTLVFSDPSGPCNLMYKVVQGGSGSYTIAWPASVKWHTAGSSPTLSTAVGAIDIISLYYDGTNYYGVSALDFQ